MKRAEARDEPDLIVAAVNGRVPAPRPSAVTVGYFVENEYLTHKSRKWKESTAHTTEQLVRVHLIAEIGARPLSSVSRQELQALLDRKAAAGLSHSVVARLRWQLRAIFRMAKSDGLIPLEPAECLTVSVKSASDKRTIALDQIVRAQMALPIRERLVFRLAVCEGMRPGEIVALQVGDFGDEVISVRRRVYRGRVDTPKSAKSQRIIPPTPITRDLLRNYIELLGETRPDAWIFASETGKTPIAYPNLYRRRIKPALAAVGLGHANFQVLRRTWVTEFSQVEKDPHIRAQIAGHSVDVHENEYRQGNRAAMADSMRRLGERLN